MSTRPTFYILDAFSLIFQVFHAIRGPRDTSVMTSPSGQPMEAVFGIFRDMLNLLRDKKPDYLAVAFDGPGPVFRSEIFADYKATRKEMPVDLVPQIPIIRTVFEGFRVPVFMEPMMEADDVIATLARRGEERGLDVFIATADKDARQLISDQVRIYNIRKNTVMDAAGLAEDWGIRPDQVVDYLALTGDSVDNVPGVPGIGPGFASTFLKEFGTLDNLLANPGRVKGPKKQQALREHKETALRARLLVALKDDIPIVLDWDALKTQGPDVLALKALCDQCGFHRFRDELGKGQEGAAAPAPQDAWEAQYQTIDSAEGFATFLEELRRQPRFCIDTETTAIDPLRASLVGLSFAWKPGEAYYLPRARADGGGDPSRARHAGGAPADSLRPLDREDRPEHQVRLARPREGRPGNGGPVHRHDGALLPARKRRAEP